MSQQASFVFDLRLPCDWLAPHVSPLKTMFSSTYTRFLDPSLEVVSCWVFLGTFRGITFHKETLLALWENPTFR